MNEKMIRQIKSEAKLIFTGDYSGHDMQHTMRVCRTAVKIAEKEGADVELTIVTALLHDVDDRKLTGKQGKAENAADILRKCGVDEKTAEKICRNIERISFHGTGENVPEDIEGRIVQDADRLDAMGAIGIARTFAYAGNKKQRLFPDEENEGHKSAVSHFYDKLLKLSGLMNTETARQMAQERHCFMLAFLDELDREMENEKDG